mmetsp:Transcript_7944/g.16591  ORF Transcript_7944/g.16591 Transcript_7944/m.16591 type:complete len:215 (-) Transcript_7944:34-678(-)
MSRVWLRFFTHPSSTTETHTFILGSTPNGLSERVATHLLPPSCTFTDLRMLVECVNDRGMNRRTTVYQDLLHLMTSSPNPHGYGARELRGYRFGYIEGVGGQETAEVSVARDYDKSLVPSLIPLDAEGERVRDVIPNLLEVDVILVPVSQIRQKDGACTAIAWREEFEMKEAEKMKKTVDYINSIDLEKYHAKGVGGDAGEEDEETKAMIAAEG